MAMATWPWLAYIPHGHCYLWQTPLVGLHVIADGLTALAYYSIPLILVYFTRQRQDLPYSEVFWLFSLFIFTCGTTHLLEVWTLWHPDYWFSGGVKGITAIASVATATVLVPIVPKALTLKSPAELAAINQSLAKEIEERKRVEAALRQRNAEFEAIFKAIPDGVVFADSQREIKLVNPGITQTFGYSPEGLLGEKTDILYASQTDYPQPERLHLNADASSEPVSYRLRYRRQSGECFTGETSATDVRDETGETLGFLVIVRDIEDLIAAEAARRQTYEQLRLFVEHTPAAIAMFDREMRYILVSRRWIEEYRLPQENLIGQSHYEVFPEMGDRWRENHRRVLAGEVLGCEADPFVRRHGSTDWVSWELRPWHGAEGEIGGIIMFTRVITDQIEMAQRLQESEERFELAVRGSGDGIWDWNVATGEAYISPRYKAILGYDEDEEFHSSFAAFTTWLHPEERDRVLEGLYDSLAHHTPYNMEYRLRRQDGTYVWVQARGRASYDEETGEAKRMSGAITDISDRRALEGEIRKQERLLNAFFDAAAMANVGFAIHDADLSYLKINQALAEINGLSVEDHHRRTIFEVVPNIAPKVFPILQQVRDRGEPQLGIEVTGETASQPGIVRDWLVSYFPIQLAPEQPTQIGAIVVEISQLKHIERQLKQANLEMGRSNQDLQDFAYIASHDLQEPLRKIIAFGDRLASQYSHLLDERGQDYLRRMRNCAARMQNLIRDLLAFSRVSSHTHPPNPIDLNKIVAEVLDNLEVSLDRTRGRVEVGELPTLDGDGLQLGQLFQNLLSNALKFHRLDVPPVVKVYEGKSNATTVEIVVSDNGIGFDEKYCDRIFTPFQRLHGRLQYEGTGMGLAICRRIVERHGGTLTARSTPGKGSTFTISLPRQQPLNS